MSWLAWLRVRGPALIALPLVTLVAGGPSNSAAEVPRKPSAPSPASLAEVRTIRVASGAQLVIETASSESHRPPKHLYVSDSGDVVSTDEVARFLEMQGSPMAQHAPEIVRAGITYSVDPRLVVAIAGVESNFGRKCRGHNAWGWNNGRTRWKSWPESIDQYTRLISERYPNWRNVKRIAFVYNPNTPEAWGRKVSYLIAAIPTA